MPQNYRRSFIASSTAWLGVGGLAGLLEFSRLYADEGQSLDVRMSAEIAPLVRLIEATPRDKAVEMMIGELGKGTTKNQFVAAMFLAAARMKVSPHHVYKGTGSQLQGTHDTRGHS